MPNAKLKNRQWPVPDQIVKFVQNAFNLYKDTDKGGNGIRRATYILNNKKLSYNEMKRIKNFFDSGNHDRPSYLLNGGDEMRNWVNQTLRQDREGIRKPKELQYDLGIDNQFIKPHEKDKSANPGKVTRPGLGTTNKEVFNDTSIYENEDIYKSMKNKIIKLLRENNDAGVGVSKFLESMKYLYALHSANKIDTDTAIAKIDDALDQLRSNMSNHNSDNIQTF